MKKINIYDTLSLILFILLYFIFYLMAEVFWNYDWYIDKIDVKGDKVPDWFNENQIKDRARKYVESRIKEWISDENREKLLKEIKDLLEKQDIERKDLIQELRKRENWEAKENADKEAMIQEAKTMIYEKLWINENQGKNSKIENFLKWVVDELVIWNYELAIEIYNTNWKVLIESLKQLASWEWIKKIAESLWDTVWNLFDWNAYEKWKSVAQLWLIWSWVWLWVAVWKKGLKLWMKELAKLRPHTTKESIIVSPEVKWLVKETWKKVDEIVPKKQLDFNKMLVEDIAKLWNKERLEAWSFYLKWKKFTPEQEKAILEAHNVWKDRKWAGIYTYTNEEIKQKAEILKQVWFSVEERRLLLQNWVCAKVSDEKLFQLNILWDTLDKQVDYLFKLAQATRKDYDSLLTEIWTWSNSLRILNSETVPLKWKENVVSKINAEYWWKHPEMVRDILRWSIVYNDLSDLRRWLQMFKDSDKVSVIHINNRLKNPNTNDILMNIRFPNWFVAEVQLHIKETLHAKEIWFKLDKSIIDLDSRFTNAERKLIQDIKEWKKWTRILNENVNLPSNWETVSWHHIYEITRSLWETTEETILKKKLNKVQEVLNNYARDLYTQRTWKDFI